jgi:hypothetical protein
VKVDFLLSGGGIRQRFIAAKLESLGWTVRWMSSSVPNGKYLLRTIVDTRSRLISSQPIVVNVKN